MSSKKKRLEARGAVRPSPLPDEKPAARVAHLLAIGAVILIALLAYSNSFQGGYTLDNNQLLTADKRIQQVNSQNLSDIWNHTYWWPYGESGLYRPLATLSYMFNYAVLGNGQNPFGFHLINLLLHFCNIALVYLLGLR